MSLSVRPGCAAGLRPFYLQHVDFGSLPDSKNHPGIVGREKTTTAHFHPASFQISSLICNPRAHGISIRLRPDQSQSEPMV